MAQKTGALKAGGVKEKSQDMQALKILVVGMGILIVLGLALIAYGLAGGGLKGTKVEADFGDLELKLPSGCVIAAAEGLDGRLVLRTDGPAERGCQQVILIDPETGKILGRVRAAY